MKVLVVVAQEYNGHELWTALGVMQQAGLEFEVISTSTRIEDEVTHQQNVIERTIDDVHPDEIDAFDGIMIVSGNMAYTEAYWKNERVLSYVDKMHRADKPIAAICCSVPTIRNVAMGKVVSFYPLIRSKALLESAGAILSTISISVDGKLVTAEHQMATQMWAEAFTNIMYGRDSGLDLVDSGFSPAGRTIQRLPHILEALIYDEEELERLRQVDIRLGRIEE